MSILVWICLLALLHTYLFYPLLLKSLSLRSKPLDNFFLPEDDWPKIHILMSLYNEEKVIARKLETLLSQSYESQKINIWIGSDCSNDGTNEIVQRYADQYEQIHFFPFSVRQGKPGVINALFEKLNQIPNIQDDLLLLTDANVFLSPQVLSSLAKHFKDPQIVLVDAHMVHTGMQEEGISKAENQYISLEVLLKHWEGLVWGKMLGPFGGCYMMRASHFEKVPPNFLVDDFFIAMKALQKGGKAINELEAICHEDVSHDLRVEYRRKKRISAGNFQNLVHFANLWWPPLKPLSFAFFSHKILRWWGPFFLLIMIFVTGYIAAQGQTFYQLFFLLLVISLIVVPLLDWILSMMKIHLVPLRGARYFVLMNLALLAGFWKFLKGIKTNVWQPTKRN